MHADYYDLTDETCIDTSSNSSNQKIKALEKVNDAFVPVGLGKNVSLELSHLFLETFSNLNTLRSGRGAEA
jgi:hypothetical protein